MLWFNDTIQMTNFGFDTQIINIDFNNEIKNFTQNYKESNFDAIVNEIENSIVNVNRNVFSPLVLTALAIKINKNLIKQKK